MVTSSASTPLGTRRSPSGARPGPFHALEGGPKIRQRPRASELTSQGQLETGPQVQGWSVLPRPPAPARVSEAEQGQHGTSARTRQGVTSPSTAAAARWRERRGGPGGLRGPDRPSCTSCRCGALKGFARARCATDENILLRGRQRAEVRETRRRAMSPETRETCPALRP